MYQKGKKETQSVQEQFFIKWQFYIIVVDCKKTENLSAYYFHN